MKSRFLFFPLYQEAAVAADPAAGAGAGQQQQQQQAAPPVHFNPDGTLGENWHTALGDEFSPHADALKNFKDVKGLAKSFLHFRGTGPAYPGDAASEEDVSRFRSAAQVPVAGTMEGYGVTLPENATDEDKAVLNRLLDVAHKSHASGPAMRAVVAEYQKIQQEAVQRAADAHTAQQKAAEDQLVSDWRGNYEVNKSAVRHLAATLATTAGIDPADPSFVAMIATPAFGKMMLEVSKLTQEDRITAHSGLGDLRSNQQRADAIMDGTDPVWGKKYTSGTSEEKQAAYNEVSRLLSSKD